MSRFLAVDLRSLALLRICYGIFLLMDLAIRAVDLVAFYTDYGACPRAAVLELGWQRAYISLHMANGSWPFQALLFAVAAVAAVALTLGYRTRLAAFISWVHLISLHNRNGMVLDGGDIYLRVILFWGLFLPWGARFSVDSVRRPGDEDNRWFDASTLAYLVQICLVYWCATVHKTGVEWRSEGTAVYYALMIEQLTTPLAPLLLGHPVLMRWLTWATLGWEALGPFFLIPNGPLRMIGVLGFAALHLGFGLFMHLAIFALIGACTPIGMLPEWFWRRRWAKGLEARLNRIFFLAEQKLARFPGAAAPPAHPSSVVSGIVVGLMLYCVAWNVCGLPGSKLKCPDDLGYLLRLDQSWNMFSPKPLTEDGWYVIEANRVGGGTLDLFQGGAPVTWEKPAHVASTYPNARWRKYMMNLWSSNLQSWRLYYGRYLTRAWNDRHQKDDQVKDFKVIFMKENTVANGTEPVEKVPIWTHYCFAMPSPSPSSSPSPGKATP